MNTIIIDNNKLPATAITNHSVLTFVLYPFLCLSLSANVYVFSYTRKAGRYYKTEFSFVIRPLNVTCRLSYGINFCFSSPLHRIYSSLSGLVFTSQKNTSKTRWKKYGNRDSREWYSSLKQEVWITVISVSLNLFSYWCARSSSTAVFVWPSLYMKVFLP